MICYRGHQYFVTGLDRDSVRLESQEGEFFWVLRSSSAFHPDSCFEVDYYSDVDDEPREWYTPPERSRDVDGIAYGQDSRGDYFRKSEAPGGGVWRYQKVALVPGEVWEPWAREPKTLKYSDGSEKVAAR